MKKKCGNSINSLNINCNSDTRRGEQKNSPLQTKAIAMKHIPPFESKDVSHKSDISIFC